MSAIDIEVSPELTDMFAIPSCADVSLPAPSSLSIQLPGGGSLSAFADLSKGIPTDCALTFSLLMQVAPFMASIACLVKVLKFVSAVHDALSGLTSPTSAVTALGKVAAAAEGVVGCALSFTPLGLIPFIRDLLCLILKVLNCFDGQMRSVVTILKQINSQIDAAASAANADLLASLTCAKNNSITQANHLISSLGPLGVVLDLAKDFMQTLGLPAINIPTDLAAGDVDVLEGVLNTLQTVINDVQQVVNLVGGCGS